MSTRRRRAKASFCTHTHGSNSPFVFVYGTDLTHQKQTEQSLAQSQRMATLGTLAAGVAHELNNPAAATQRGAEQLSDAFSSLEQAYLQLIHLNLDKSELDALLALDAEVHKRSATTSNLDPLTRSDNEAAIEDWLENQDIEDAWEIAPALVSMDFQPETLADLKDDFSAGAFARIVLWLGRAYPVYSVANEIGLGAKRISEIVKALKEYSYVGEAPIQDVDVRTGIDNTLVILRSKLRQGVTVHRDYADDIPKIQAFGSELNQVWTNIIDNAVDAMDGRGEIKIRARRENASVIVEIEDDGPGIPAEIQSQIFDPFFTTKAPGSGSGLGMSISYGIVAEKHAGTIEVESEPGATRFIVTLPLVFQVAQDADAGAIR